MYPSPQQPADDEDSGFAATVLSVPAPDSLISLPFAETAPAGAAPPPTIGRYALELKLGEGGLGSVYQAWDPLLSRKVALKTVQFAPGMPADGPSLDALFLNEARVAAGLDHPYIVTIFDAGLSASGIYIAMERLRGRDLRCALSEGWRPEPVEAAQLARRVAAALGYAHSRGIVHCDIKPANIFLTRRGRPKVLDFGIARVAHHAGAAALDGLVAGSPHYLAPEQLERGVVDARTDVYSLGVVLYELLCGRKAFEGHSLGEIAAAVHAGAAPPLGRLKPALPRELVAITERAMARESAERYPRAIDLARDLRRWARAVPKPAPAAPARHAWSALTAACAGWMHWPRRHDA